MVLMVARAWSLSLASDKEEEKKKHTNKSVAVPGVEPGSSGSQPLMLTTTPANKVD